MLAVYSSPSDIKFVYKCVLPVCLYINLIYVFIDAAMCDGFAMFFEEYSHTHKKQRFNKINTVIIIHATHIYLRHLGVFL